MIWRLKLSWLMQLNHLFNVQKKATEVLFREKKRHTLKTQLVVDAKKLTILATTFSEGKLHDFKLYKKSKLPLNPNIQVNVDTGYLGIKKIIKYLHQNVYL